MKIGAVSVNLTASSRTFFLTSRVQSDGKNRATRYNVDPSCALHNVAEERDCSQSSFVVDDQFYSNGT